MASSPRTGRTSPALFAVVIGAVLILGVIAMVVLGFDPVRVGQGVLSSFFPPQAVTDRGEHIRQLYDIVFGIAVVIFTFPLASRSVASLRLVPSGCFTSA